MISLFYKLLNPLLDGPISNATWSVPMHIVVYLTNYAAQWKRNKGSLFSKQK